MSDELTIDTGSEEYKKAASGGGGGKPIAKGVHEFTVKAFELKKSGNTGKHYLKVDLQLRDSKRRLFDNYLSLDRDNGQFKRTASFLEAVGLSGQINLPEVAKSGELVGRPVKNKITSYSYAYGVDENGNNITVSDWQKDFAEIEASGKLSGPDITVDAEAGFYSISDYFDEWFDQQADSAPSNEEVWS